MEGKKKKKKKGKENEKPRISNAVAYPKASRQETAQSLWYGLKRLVKRRIKEQRTLKPTVDKNNVSK